MPPNRSLTAHSDQEVHETVTSKIVFLHKYLNDKQKVFCSLQFFQNVVQDSLMIPCSEKSLSIPGAGVPSFLGLWP